MSVFVVWEDQVLLHLHPRLGLWLPPGGHVEPGELPDDAAVREVQEEAGVKVELVGEAAITAPGPRQLVRPRGVQLEAITARHEHIDLIYFARPAAGAAYGGELGKHSSPNEYAKAFGWYGLEEALRLPLTPEMGAWVDLALTELAGGGNITR